MKKIVLIALLIGSALSFAEEDEEGAAVGPDKGILEQGERGFRLSPEAIKTIDFKTSVVSSSQVPCSAIVSVKDQKFVFRSSDGWMKSVRVDVASKNGANCAIRESELKNGDSIVVTQVGFLRIAEVLLVEGASHSH